MDFQSMKRKELQSLCKKHNLPANSTNQAMAQALSSLLKVEQVDRKARRGRSCLKRSVETAADDGAEILKKDKVKKVRFSPHEEFYEFEASTAGRYPLRNRYATGRPAMVSGKVKKRKTSVVEAIGNSDRLVAGCSISVRSLRSREVVSVCGDPVSRIHVELGDSGTKEENDPGKTSKNVVGDYCFLNNMMQTRSRKKGNGNPKESGEQSDNQAVKKGFRRSRRTSLAVDEMAESENSNKCDEGTRKIRRAKAGESLKKDEVLNQEFGLSQTRSQMRRKKESVKAGKEDSEEVHEKLEAENRAGCKGANRSLSNAPALAEKVVIKNLKLLGSDVHGRKNNKNLRKTRSMTVSEKLKKNEEVEEEVCVSKNSMLTRSKKQKHDNSAGGDEILVDSELQGALCDKICTDDRTQDKRVQHPSKHNAQELHETAAEKNTAMESSQSLGIDHNKNYRRTRRNNSMVVSENSKKDEVVREVVLTRNLRQTRSQKLKTNKVKEHDEVCHVLSGRISAETGAVDEGMRQHKSKTQVFDEMVWENTKPNGSKGLDADQRKPDRIIRKTRSSVAIESLKNNEVEREVDSSNHRMQPVMKRSTSVSEGLNSDGELGGGVGLSKHSRFIGTSERKNDKQTVDEEEIMNPGEVLKKDCNMERTGMVVDRMTAEDPQVDRMVGMAVASLNQSLKKGMLAEEALEGEDGNGTKVGTAHILHEHAMVFAIEDLPERPRDNSCEASTLSKFHSESDETTINEGSAFMKVTSDAKGGNGHDVRYGERSRRLEQGTPVDAFCVSSNGSKVTGDETMGKQMEDIVLQADSPAHDCKVGDEFEVVVNDHNKANTGLKRTESHTGEEKCSKFPIDSSVPSCENSAEAVPNLVLHEDTVLSAELEECIKEAGRLSASNTDNVKKELASEQKSCGKKEFFKANMPGKEWSSNESNREVPPVAPVLTNTVLSEFKEVVLVGSSHSADLMNMEVKDCVGNMSIGNKMEDQQCGGEQLSGADNSIPNHVSLVVYPDGGFHAERGFMPEKQIMEADKDGLAFRSHEEVQNSFRLKSKLMDIVAKETTEEAVLASNDSSVIQEVASGFVAATTSDFTLTSSLDAQPIDAIEFLELKATVATSACKHDTCAELSPGRDVDIIVHHDCSGGAELEESQNVNKMAAAHCEAGVKHPSLIEGYQGEDLLSSLLSDSVHIGSKKTTLGSDSEYHEGSHHNYHEWFDHEIDDKEFSEQAGVTHSNSGKIDNQNIEVSETSNKNFEVLKEQLEDGYRIELGTAESILQKLDSSGSEERADDSEVNSVVLEEFKDSVQSIVTNSAYWSLEGEDLQIDSEEIAEEKRNIETVEEIDGCEDGLDPGAIMAIGPDNELGHCKNRNESFSCEIECGKDGGYSESFGRGKASFGLKNVVLEANGITISKGMEGMCQADISAEGGYQEKGSVVMKGCTAEGIVPCNDASSIQEIAIGAEAATKNTESVSSDQVLVRAIQVTESRGMNGNSLACNLDMGTKGFSPERVVGTATQLNCDGIPEPSDTQKVNHSTSGSKHFSSIQAIQNQGEDLLSSLSIDSVDFSLKETLLVCDSENHEDSYHDYIEWFDHEIDDKEFSELAGVTHSNSGQIDTQNIEGNNTCNKNFEVMKEQLEDRYMLELGTAETILQRLDSSGSEERPDTIEVNKALLEEFKDSESIVSNSASWILKGKELKVDSEEIAEDNRNIETVEETGGCGDGLDEPADEKENKVILMDKCGSDFEQSVVVSLSESVKQLSGTAEIVCDANDTEKRLAANDVGYIISEEIEDATSPIANDLADDLECMQMDKSDESTKKKRNVDNSKEADDCMYIIKPINKEENTVILMDKSGRPVEQFVAAAPVALKEHSELDGTTATGEKSISLSDGPASRDNTPRSSKDSGFPCRHNISAEKQEEGSSQAANICASAKKFASVEDNLFCGCDAVTDSRNPIKKSSEFQVEDLNTNSCMMKTQEGAGRSKTESVFEEMEEASDRAKITLVQSELNRKAQASSIYPWEKHNGRGHLEIIKIKEFDESFQEGIGSMDSEEVMRDEENEIKREFVYGCSTGDVVVMEEENTNDSQYAKSDEEKLSCEASEVIDTKAMADMNAEKFNHLECPEAAPMKSDKPSAAPEAVERAFGVICEEESSSKHLTSVTQSEEAPYLEIVEIDAVNSHKEPGATKGPEKDECKDEQATKRRNSSLSVQSKLVDELKCRPIAAEMKENMPVMKEKANTHQEVKSATPLRRRALENLQSSERTRNEKTRVFNC